MARAGNVGHYILVTSASAYGGCSPTGSAGGQGPKSALMEGDMLGADCNSTDSNISVAAQWWRDLEQPLWDDAGADQPSLSFTVVRTPDMLGEAEPLHTLVPLVRGPAGIYLACKILH